jgi:hypothetical protein
MPTRPSSTTQLLACEVRTEVVLAIGRDCPSATTFNRLAERIEPFGGTL